MLDYFFVNISNNSLLLLIVLIAFIVVLAFICDIGKGKMSKIIKLFAVALIFLNSYLFHFGFVYELTPTKIKRLFDNDIINGEVAIQALNFGDDKNSENIVIAEFFGIEKLDRRVTFRVISHLNNLNYTKKVNAEEKKIRKELIDEIRPSEILKNGDSL